MKIITLHKPISIIDLYEHLRENLNPVFQKQRQSDIIFLVERRGNTIEILQPELYEGILFRIELDDDELRINRSEHYVDDVNSLTLESVLNQLFEDVSGKDGTNLVQEG